MAAYTVLARKYRPQTFADLSGQEHVTRTLGNAIGSGRVAHAFLFTGVRGVGKTTTARILAKALNCEKGPTPEPCGVCDACREITTGLDLDVLEIDGASNNSVDDVRRLQETIPFRPARDRFKIVIVDEVHMLSTGAFNAFLNTLEEPPAHVKFIFATTESHKVPITIRSRCQRYDFRLIPEQVVADRVRTILAAEKIRADEKAVAIVSREASGSMRDALTLLDQIVAFAGDELVGDDVARVLGIADRELLFRMAAAILTREGAEVLTVVEGLAARGLDMLHFARALTELFRDLVVLSVAGADTPLVVMVDEERARAIDLAGAPSALELQRAFASVSLLVDEVAKSTMPRTTLEMGLVRLATRPPLRAIAEVVARLDALESGAASAPRSSAPARSATRQAPAREAPRRAPVASPNEADQGAAEILRKLRGAERRASTPGARKAASADSEESEPEEAVADERVAIPPIAAAPPSVAVEARARAAAPLDLAAVDLASVDVASGEFAASEGRASDPGAPIVRPEHHPALDRLSDPPTRSSAPPAPPEAPRVSADAMAKWESVVAVLMETRPALGSVLQHATPAKLSARTVVLAFPAGSFYARQARAPEALAAIADVAERLLGGRPSVEITEGEAGDGASTLAQVEAERTRARMDATRKRALNHPMVVEILSVFDLHTRFHEVRLDGE